MWSLWPCEWTTRSDSGGVCCCCECRRNISSITTYNRRLALRLNLISASFEPSTRYTNGFSKIGATRLADDGARRMVLVHQEWQKRAHSQGVSAVERARQDTALSSRDPTLRLTKAEHWRDGHQHEDGSRYKASGMMTTPRPCDRHPGIIAVWLAVCSPNAVEYRSLQLSRFGGFGFHGQAQVVSRQLCLARDDRDGVRHSG